MKIFFVQFFCVVLSPLLNIVCFCYSLPFLSFIEPIFAWNIPLVSLVFLKRSLVFPILLFSSISLHWMLRKAFLSLISILWNSAFKWVYLSFSPLLFASLLFAAICKASSDSYFAFFHFFFLYILHPIFVVTFIFFFFKMVFLFIFFKKSRMDQKEHSSRTQVPDIRPKGS